MSHRMPSLGIEHRVVHLVARHALAGQRAAEAQLAAVGLRMQHVLPRRGANLQLERTTATEWLVDLPELCPGVQVSHNHPGAIQATQSQREGPLQVDEGRLVVELLAQAPAGPQVEHVHPPRLAVPVAAVALEESRALLDEELVVPLVILDQVPVITLEAGEGFDPLAQLANLHAWVLLQFCHSDPLPVGTVKRLEAHQRLLFLQGRLTHALLYRGGCDGHDRGGALALGFVAAAA
mmetsp:Transcript_82932/g.221603  ORF Transcript_82932/g.221603 Transcript_82932/m.221603 type:complete len:236 (-) Transcript_82932:24-731(-)